MNSHEESDEDRRIRLGEIARQLKAGVERLASSGYFERLAEAQALGTIQLDELGLHSLVSIEMRIPPDSENEHARSALEACANARSANSSMKANNWLRAALAAEKDFMLWDDSILGGAHRKSQAHRARQGGKSAEEQKRIAAKYWQRVGNGEKYGALKALAADHDLSERQIKNIVALYPPN